jgi:Bacterial low temperature requirement A protein (LtrA)
MRIAVSRAPGAERVVTPLELFFDLVYVFAIGQLSHHLLEHLDLRTGAETLIVATAPLTLLAGIAASTAVLVAVAVGHRRHDLVYFPRKK